MNIFQRRAVLKKANYLSLTPVRLVEEEIGEDNIVTLLFPRFINKFAKKYIVPRLKKPPHIKLKLDKLGSISWLAIDGKKKVGDIAIELKQKLDDPAQSLEELEQRLTKFLTLLYEQKIITFAEVQV